MEPGIDTPALSPDSNGLITDGGDGEQTDGDRISRLRFAARSVPELSIAGPQSPTPGPSWMIDRARWTPASTIVKRQVDVLLSSLLLIALSPIVLLALLLIGLSSRGPLIFRQRRVGLHGQIFEMFKLRSMIEGAEALEEEFALGLEGRTFFKIEDDPRVTPIGRWLRKLSIDEIPQLVNVLRGEMSLVGPRPLLLVDFEKFPKGRQLRRLGVLPGLTGLWQVNGRSETSDEQRIRLDLEYVDRWSLWLDLKIIVKTVGVVLSAKGAT